MANMLQRPAEFEARSRRRMGPILGLLLPAMAACSGFDSLDEPIRRNGNWYRAAAARRTWGAWRPAHTVSNERSRASTHECVQPCRLTETLHRDFAAILEEQLRVTSESSREIRDEDLPRPGEGQDPRRLVHGETMDLIPGDLDLAGVNGCSDGQRKGVCNAMASLRASHSSCRPVEER